MRGRCLSLTAACLLACAPLSFAAQQVLLDRIVARVGGYPITLTDVRAAVALGIVEGPPDADEEAAVGPLVDRRLILAEVERFAPPEPAAADIAREVAAMTARAGERLAAVMAETGVDDARIRDLARDTLRIEAYLNQRFGTTTLLSEEDVLRYYGIHPEEFMRDGRLMPFGEAEPLARQRAGAERRAATIGQWLRDLRARADITINPSRPGA